MKRDIRAVFFDLDDTLCAYWAASRKGLRQAIDEAGLALSTDDVIRAWREVFSTFSKEVKTDAWYRHYLESGEPTRTEHLKRTLELLGIPDEGKAKSLSDNYARLRDQYLVLFPEALSLLQHLQGRYCLGLITNGPADIQRQEIETLGIAEFFDHIFIEGEFKIGKPHAEIFDAARDKCGFEPEQMLFVGNAFEHDVQGAKRAGWWAIWVNRGEEYDPGTDPRPDAEIVHLYEVCDWLGIDAPVAPKAERPVESKNWR
jgi:putative hydrolase of the HAD superfamily